MKKLLITALLVGFTLAGMAQERVLYKQTDTTKLYMEVYSPAEIKNAEKLPALLFYFGGGWNGGSIKQFERHAKYLTEKGMVCFLVEYRVKTRNNTSPFESLKDAKSAVRFVRENANKFHVDADKILAGGGSAGGHLAAATAHIEGFNDAKDNLSISCKPCALVLFNPVIDNGPAGYGFERIGEAYKEFSPLHNVKKGAPPTIFFLGTIDPLIPVQTAEYYKVAMDRVGSRCDLFLYEGEGHGFFNSDENYKKTIAETDKFLTSLGYLK
jgi:acetyl esterase/lipase|tara:strand:- start:24306 stop:25112 length:807 start_codon:yes stop_codon:yes gene_type:complete